MAQRLKSHSLAGCRPLDLNATQSFNSLGHSIPFLPRLPANGTLLSNSDSLSVCKYPLVTSQSAPEIGSRVVARAGLHTCSNQLRLSTTPLRTDPSRKGQGSLLNGRKRRSVLVNANGGDFEFDDGDDDGDGGGALDGEGLDDIEFEFDAPEGDHDQDDGDAYADDEEAVNLEDEDFEIDDYETLDPETIDVEDLDEMISAEGLGDTSKVRRVPYKIDEDYYHKLRCQKPPFDFYIRKNEQGFLNLSQIYGGDPYSERYVIPSMSGDMPNEFHRYQSLSWHTIVGRDHDSEKADRFPATTNKTMRWYLCRCFEDRDLMLDPKACLMTEHVWMFDAKARHVEKVDVKMEVTMGPDRDRKNEVLVIKPQGVIARNQEDMEDPGHIIEREARHNQLLKIEGYLQVFRDYNWEGLRPRWEENLRDPSKVYVTPELIQALIDEGRLTDTPQLWENLKLERPKEKVAAEGKVQLPTQRFKRK
ncbi:hypothetical protein KFL_002480130 [Klebsormidium nitens]|uniref:Uncharacterized protein n=1 Tax=Klebsormidium nitens TaxID=105231 RepID=A0A1Y1I410_KLENI|nr:hypothetical protein KFL_002480130 [Klebsormidium nitens]|eukprot:GAQ85675.1 hypothetical protein KFL_002480130 [Klebsormidium nitens]